MHIRLLINPNTSAAMTASIGAAAQRIAAPATHLTAVNPPTALNPSKATSTTPSPPSASAKKSCAANATA